MELRFQEGVPLSPFESEGTVGGIFKLRNDADPQSIKINLCGNNIEPTFFNKSGWPIVSKRVYDQYKEKENEFKLKNGDDFVLRAIIEYDTK